MTLLIKEFVKKYLALTFLFSKSVIHNIFTINFHNIVNCRYSNIFYSFNIFIDTMPHTQPNLFPFLFFFLFFLPFSLNQKSQPYTFCNTQLNSRVKKKKGRGGGGSDILRSHTCDPTYPTPLNHTSHKNRHSLGRPLICFFFFFFFHTTNTSFYHSLISFNSTHSIASPPPLENSIGKR